MRRTSPSSQRNQQPILDVLSPQFADGQPRLVLEIASGTGEHAVFFARQLPHVTWQPSDVDALSRASIAAHIAHQGIGNVRSPLALDVHQEPWPIEAADAVFCANMFHISPWTATEASFAGCKRLLQPGGLLFTYGPYFQSGVEPSAGNLVFDQDLRRRNQAWGIRQLDDIVALADGNGFDAPTVVQMPANNLSLLFRKR